MTKLLQEKDAQWRERPNGASPVFDPGMSALGTDDEAGGATASPATGVPTPGIEPMPAQPAPSARGPRLTLPVWWTAAGLLTAALAVVAIASFR